MMMLGMEDPLGVTSYRALPHWCGSDALGNPWSSQALTIILDLPNQSTTS